MKPGGPKSELPTTSITYDGTLRTVTRIAEPDLGARLGQFRVEARLGQGGLGIVYRAYDEKLKRDVALKVLAEASSTAGVHLLEEARAAASLTHPSIAAIHDVQQQNGLVFIVMELVPGATLRAEMRRGPIAAATVLRYARDIAAGLARAHKSGIVHRDLKPENVMVTPDGAVKILDFGLARQAPDVAPPSGEAEATGIAGTPAYMAPEQSRGGRVDPRADVFSLGVVLYEMLAGKRPFVRSKAAGFPSSDDWTIGAPLGTAAPGAPPDLVRVVERCLAIERGARFANGAEVLDALRAVEESRPTPPRGARRRVVRGSLALLATGGLAAGIVAIRPRPSAPSAPVAAPSPSSAEAMVFSSAPKPLAGGGLCAGFPVFLADGTLVFARQEATATELHRLDLTSGADTALTDDRGSSLRPARGEPGQIVYMFRNKGMEGGDEIRSVAATGGAHRTLLRGTDPTVAAGALFFLQQDARAIRRAAVDGSGDEVLYEAPPSTLFDSLAVSADARWMATSTTGFESRPATAVCTGRIAEDRPPLDCDSAGMMTSHRATFSPLGEGLYFARGNTVVRLDPATHAMSTARLPVAPTTLAIAPDASTMVLSTCRVTYEAVRAELDGTTTPLPAVAGAVGLLNVGPHGELGFPVAHENQASLGIADPAGAEVRVMTSADHFVTEIAFSPDGRRVAFHDANPGTGGLFVADLDGASAATRVTTAADDSAPSWLDSEHIVYLHAEKGIPYGRASVVAAAGGEVSVLPKLPGVLLGAVPARGTLLLGIRSPSGDRVVEATRDGKLRELPLRGLPKGMRWEVATAASPSGRFVAWYSGGAAWRADFVSGVASRVEFPWPQGVADAIQPDDEGRVTASFRHSEGELYEVQGRFP